MRKLFTLIIVATLFATSANAQVFSSNFDNWSGGVPTDWMGTRTSIYADSVIQVAGVYGANAVQLVNTDASSHKRFTTQDLTSVAGQSYEIKFWAKGNGEVRSGLVDDDYHYADYITISTSTWTEYSQVVTATAAVDTAQFMLSLRATVAPDHIQIDSFVVTTTTAQTVTIHDIQYTTDASGDSPLNGQTVNTGGIVSAILGSGYFVQDAFGAWNGVYVFDANNTVNYGDMITFTCLVTEYYNMTELKNVANFAIVSSGNPLYNPKTVSTADVNTEQYEGVLIKVYDANCTNADAGYGQWVVNDGSGDAMTDDKIYSFTPTAGTEYNVTGVMDYSYDEFKILYRGASDIEVSTSVSTIENNTVKVFPNPTSDYVNINTNKSVANVTFFNIVGEEVKTVNNSNRIDITDLNQGIYIINIQFTDNSKSTFRVNIK